MSIPSPWLTPLLSLTKKYTTVKYLSCSQAYLNICSLWPWPFDLWPPKSIGSSFHQGLHVCQVWSRNTQRFCRYGVHKLIHRCQLWAWTLTSKINTVHPLTMVNMSANFDKETHNGLVAIVFTRLFPFLIWLDSFPLLKLYCRYEFTKLGIINHILGLKQLWLQVNGHGMLDFIYNSSVDLFGTGGGRKKSNWKYKSPAGFKATPSQSTTGK